MTVNGRQKHLYIDQIEVAAETATAILASPVKGKVHLIDIGAGTIGLATIDNMRFIDRDSMSLNVGAETTSTKDVESMANMLIATVEHKWDRGDKIMLIGGMAETIYPYVKHIGDVSILNPVHNGTVLPAIYSNAVGFYNLGAKLWK